MRVRPPWRAWALRDAARRAAYDGRPPLFIAPGELNEREKSLWHEGVAMGAYERFEMNVLKYIPDGAEIFRRTLMKHSASEALPSSDAMQGIVLGLGEQIMSSLTGSGPSLELDRWGSGGAADRRLTLRLNATAEILAPFGDAAAQLIARGMGRAAALRRPKENTISTLFSRFYPSFNADRLIEEFWSGYGEGQARETLATARWWASPEGGLCRYLPRERAAGCDIAFESEMTAFGMRIEKSDRNGVTEYRLQNI